MYQKYGKNILPFLNALDIFGKSIYISFYELVTLVRINASMFQTASHLLNYLLEQTKLNNHHAGVR